MAVCCHRLPGHSTPLLLVKAATSLSLLKFAILKSLRCSEKWTHVTNTFWWPRTSLRDTSQPETQKSLEKGLLLCQPPPQRPVPLPRIPGLQVKLGVGVGVVALLTTLQQHQDRQPCRGNQSETVPGCLACAPATPPTRVLAVPLLSWLALSPS